MNGVGKIGQPRAKDKGFPGGSVVKNPLAIQEKQEIQVRSWVRKITWRREWQSTLIFLPGKSQVRGAWRATVHSVTKNRTQVAKAT